MTVAGACLREAGDTFTVQVVGRAGIEAVRRQVERIFSLDVDGSSFAAIGERDPVVGKLQVR